MPRLLLVFWSVVFLGFETGSGVLLLFVIVVIRDPKEVFLWIFRLCFIGGCIIPGSRGTRAAVFLFAFLFLKPLFGLFPSLLGSLCIAGGTICGLGVLNLWFRLFNSRIFHCNALSLYLGRGDVSGTIALQTLVVYLFDIRSGLEACFGFSLDRFLDYLFPGIQFSALLFYLGIYERLEVFPEEFNKVRLF